MAFGYRKEIDGLRALAVIPVILYHAGIGPFSGGYTGVDVFFVISGYLITSIILTERSAGNFTLGKFYERRARRILPALFFVMVCCIPFAWAWMTQIELKEFFQSVGAVALFVSNFLFWEQTGYFAAAAIEKPLLHTWSLAVEEQFYLLFPLFLIFLWRFQRRWIFIAIATLAVVSLAFSQYASSHFPIANFYLAPSRVWELMIGALLALATADGLLHERASAMAGQILALLGLILIVGSFVLFNDATPFPSFYALAPALGTALIIAFARQETLVGRLLASPPFVGIGLISYSAYLWHQPLFAFARLRSLNQPSPMIFAGLSVVALILAFFTWRYIEKPVRDRRRFDRRMILRAAVTASVVLVAVGAVGKYTAIGSYAQRFSFSPTELAAIDPPTGNQAVARCHWQTPVAGMDKLRTCQFGSASGTRPVLLFGDSHADALFAALDEAFKQKGIAGILVKNGYCGAIVGVYERQKTTLRVHHTCVEGHQAFLDYAKATGAQGMVVSIRWTFQLYPIKGAIDTLDYDNGEGGNGDESYREYYAFDGGRFTQTASAKANALKGFVESLLTTGMPIFLVYQVPEMGWHVADYDFKQLLHGAGLPSTISTDFARYRDRNRFVSEQLDALGERDNLVRIKPAEVFCDTYVPGRCAAQIDSRSFYNDDDHLNNNGAALLVARIVQKIP